MVKNHLKRHAVPKTWPIKRKLTTFITRPEPGAHPLNLGMPLNVVLIHLLKLANTTKETKLMVNTQDVIVDGRKVKSNKMMVGLMDVLNLPKIGKAFRIMLDNKGKIALHEIDTAEQNIKPCKITGKSLVKGKTQLNLADGKNILVDKDDYKTGDTIMVELPSNNIKEHVKFDKGAMIYMTGGKHVGDIGIVEEIRRRRIIFKSKSGGVYQTLKRYAYVIGKDKPLIKMIK